MEALFDPKFLDESLQDHLRRNEVKYRQLGLKQNPFPLGGNYPDGYLEYTFYDPAVVRQLRDFLVSTFVREEFDGLLVLGEYGSGKSHVLHYLKSEINSNAFFDKQAQCFLIQNPSVTPEDVVISMLREVKLNVIQDLVFRPVADKLQEEYRDSALKFFRDFTDLKPQLQLGVEYKPQAFDGIFTLSYREFNKWIEEEKIKLDPGKFQGYAQAALSERLTLGSPVLIAELSRLLASSDASQSWELLLASKLLNGKGPLAVEYYFQVFLELFRLSGIRHVYLLIDEVEDLKTQRLTSKASVEYLATLRRMIQHNYKLFSLALACTSDAWADLRLLYPAIQDRFPKVLPLASNEDSIKLIIAQYLLRGRPENFKTDNPWMPFSEGAIEYVIEKRSVLRHVLTELRSLIDQAVEQNMPVPLDEGFVDVHLSTTIWVGP